MRWIPFSDRLRPNLYGDCYNDPFRENPRQEKSLEWYFETWITFPVTDTVRAETAKKSVREYGEKLFEQVFGDRKAYSAYQAVSAQLSQLKIEIIGDPEFQALHWESLWEPEQPNPLAVNCKMSRRRLTGDLSRVQVQESPILNLLVVTARPREERDVGYRTISRPLVEAIANAHLRVNVEMVRPGTYEAFAKHLEGKQGFYHIVHFDLHGGLMRYEQFQQYAHPQAGNYTFQRGYGLANLPSYEGAKAFLFFEGEESGQAVPVSAQEMSDRLKLSGIPVCILNACQSGKQIQFDNGSMDERETSLGAGLMDAGMQMVVAMGYSVTVSAAKLFLEQMYGQLFGQQPLPEAVRRGRKELFERKQRQVYYNQVVDLEDWLLPVVYANQDVDFRLRPMSFAEEEDYFTKQATQYQFGGTEFKTEYGFVGRDLDILKLEKALLRHHVLLLQGMGGTGKTTLLRYLQDWWVQTHFMERVFYFGYDTKAWTLAQILHSIGKAVYPDVEQRMFQAMPIEAQMGKLVKTLRGQRYGLMLDNLESVTGQALAIQNTLPPEEQILIQRFLEQLGGGQALVVLGSRGPEEWLRGIYKQNRYELRGLDSQARTELAQKILARHVSDVGWRAALLKGKDFERLMKLLAGYPLAMQVVLPNLARQSAAAVLEELDAADVGLDRVGTKTESILKCVEYSHSNLSPAAQKLLLCLAPFSGFIYRSGLQNYGQVLQQLEPFKDYPFEQFDAAVQEAINWGLLSPMSTDNPRLLTIQPVFPYFLKTKLGMQDAEIKSALREGFKTHYQGLAGSYNQLMESKDPEERQIGIQICKLEYENLYHALQICLERQESVDIFFCLYTFFDRPNDIQSKLTLSEFVCKQHEKYPSELRTGEIGLEIVLSLGNLGNCYLSMKNYPQAKTTYEKVLGLLEQLEDIFKNQKLSIQARTYHQMGIVAQELREFEEARRNYQQALEICIEFGARYEQARTYHEMGRVAQELREFEEARRNYQQALEINIEFGDRYSQASTYHQLGIVAQEFREFEEARRNYQQALEIDIEFGDRYSQASTYGQLGLLAQVEQNLPEAITNLLKALEIFAEFQDNHAVGITLRNLAQIYLTSQDHSLLVSISQVLDMSVEQVQELLERYGE